MPKKPYYCPDFFHTQKKGAGGFNVANITATASFSKDTEKKMSAQR